MDLYGKVRSVDPGSVWFDAGSNHFKFSLRVNGRTMTDEEPFVRASDARQAMGELVNTMRKRHGVVNFVKE